MLKEAEEFLDTLSFLCILSHTIFVDSPSSHWPFACCVTVLVCIIAWLAPGSSLTLGSSL